MRLPELLVVDRLNDDALALLKAHGFGNGLDRPFDLPVVRISMSRK